MRSYERRFGLVLLAYFALIVSVLIMHWTQDALGPGDAWIYSCRTMGDRHCDPGEPVIRIGR